MMITPQKIRRALKNRILWAINGRPKSPELLEMIWPTNKSNNILEVMVPSDYILRNFTENDKEAYFSLLNKAGMSTCPLNYWEKHILPDGFFVVEDKVSHDLVAACFASHHPTERHPYAGNFGWLAADPSHSGRGLGYCVSAAVTNRLLKAGYKRIYLETHDFRKAAIKIYLRMGWVPLLYNPKMYDRWKLICKELNFQYTPNEWINYDCKPPLK